MVAKQLILKDKESKQKNNSIEEENIINENLSEPIDQKINFEITTHPNVSRRVSFFEKKKDIVCEERERVKAPDDYFSQNYQHLENEELLIQNNNLNINFSKYQEIVYLFLSLFKKLNVSFQHCGSYVSNGTANGMPVFTENFKSFFYFNKSFYKTKVDIKSINLKNDFNLNDLKKKR